MIFKEIANMESVGVICHYFLVIKCNVIDIWRIRKASLAHAARLEWGLHRRPVLRDDPGPCNQLAVVDDVSQRRFAPVP